MNNEEKIISMLEALTTTVGTLVQGQVKLEAGQAKLESRVEDIHNTLARLENENEQAHGAIFDKLDDLQKKAEASIVEQQLIDERIENHDLRIIRLENRVLSVR